MNEITVQNKELETGIIDVNSRALSIKIKDSETYRLAGEILLLSKDIEKKIIQFFKPLKAKAHDAWRSLCQAETDELAKLNPGIDYIKRQIAVYQAEEEKKRQAEEERLRLEALKAEEERKLQEALQLEKEGLKEEAQAVLEEQTFVPTPIVEKSVPKVSGIAMRDNWQFRVVAEAKIPRMYMTPDLVKIGKVVKALKDKCNIEGIEVYNEPIVAAGRRNSQE